MNVRSILASSSRQTVGAAAFTLRDALGCLAGVALLASVAIPTVGNTKVRSDRAVCAGNLGIIGLAFNQWAFNHNGLYPAWVGSIEGGVQYSGRESSPNSHFNALSAELTSYAVLACPADRRVRPRHGPIASTPLVNDAISYLVAWPRPEEGRLILSGDYYIGGGGPDLNSISPTGIRHPHMIPQNSPTIRWLPGFFHPDAGNLLFNDGSVEWTDNSRLRQVIQSYPDSVQVEFLTPRMLFDYPTAPAP